MATPLWETTGRGFFGMSPIMGNSLRRLRISKGWTQEQAADAMRLSRSGYIKLERGERKLNEASLQNAAKAFGVETSQVIKARSEVPIVGQIGDHSLGTIDYAREDGVLGWAPMPPDAGDRTVAIVVQGDVMRGVAEDGWIIYYEEEPTKITEEMIGHLCIIWLSDKKVVVRKPYHSRADDRFDLEHPTLATMREQKVEKATFVTWLAPRRTRERMHSDAG